MKRFCQRDPRWKDERIDGSKTTIGQSGCLISSLCSLFTKFHPQSEIRPDKVAKEWKFVSNGGDHEPQYLDWTHTDFRGMKFRWRQYAYQPNAFKNDPVHGGQVTQAQLLKDFSKSSQLGIALEVQTKTGGRHWLALVGPSILNWAAIDPWDGKMLWSAAGLLGRYKRILGFAIMEKDDLPSN